MPVAVMVGIAIHSLLNGRLVYSSLVTALASVAMFGMLFMWLMG